MRKISCPSSESWREFLHKDLDSGDLEALEGHLEGCELCSSLLEDLSGRWRHTDGLSGQVAGPCTIEVLARVIADDLEPADRGPGVVEATSPPEVPGVVELELVGRGGMGMVFRGREVDLDRPVAVKVLSSAGLLAASARSRAIREALLMASLRHPNVVQVYRSGEVSGVPFLVMEWVEGGTLQSRINAGRVSPREAAETVRDLARAVAEAHALGITHRDLKPDNVLIAPTNGQRSEFIAKLTDFGLARRGGDEGLTESGVLLGTPGYMAPEQTGLDPNLGEVGPATDIHGLGAILFAALIGRAPYAGLSSWESLIRAARGTPLSVRDLRPDISRDLATIVEKCLQTSTSRRYRSAGELADDLDRFLEGRPIAARPISAPERWLKWGRRRPALAATAALLVAASIGSVAGTVYHVVSIELEQVRTKDALDSATAARDLARVEQLKTKEALDSATAARDQARAALGSLTDDVVKRMVQRGKALDEADRAFLRKVRGYYEKWPLEPDPRASLKFQAAGLIRISDIFLSVNRYDDARTSLELAIEAYDELGRRGMAGPDEVDARLDTMISLFRLLWRANRLTDAEAIGRKLIDSVMPLAESNRPGGRYKLATLRCELGSILASLGRLQESDALFLEGLAGFEQLRLENPRNGDIRHNEQRSYFNAGLVANKAGRRDLAEARYRRLVALCEDSIVALPGKPGFYDQRIMGLKGIVDVLLADRPEEALVLHRRRMELSRELSAWVPNNNNYRSDLVTGAAMTSQICETLHRPAEAEADLEQAVTEGERLLAAEPAVYDRTHALCLVLSRRARLFNDTGRPRLAVEQYDRILAIATPWTKTADRASEVKGPLISNRMTAAQLLSKLGEHAEAVQRLVPILEICEPAMRGQVHLKIAYERLAAGDQSGARADAQQAAKDPGLAAEAAKLLASIPPGPEVRK